jgi:hypothetical protein
MVGVLIGAWELSVLLIHTQGAKQDPASFILDGSIFEPGIIAFTRSRGWNVVQVELYLIVDTLTVIGIQLQTTLKDDAPYRSRSRRWRLLNECIECDDS